MAAEQRRPGRYPAEFRERAVRLVFEAEQHTESQWETICSVAEKLGPTAETVRKWSQSEIDGGRRDGVSSAERQRIRELEREVRDCDALTRFFTVLTTARFLLVERWWLGGDDGADYSTLRRRRDRLC